MFACPICRLVVERGMACPRDGVEGEPVTFDAVPRSAEETFRARRTYARGDTGTLYLAEERAGGRSGLLKVLRLRSGVGRIGRDMLVSELRKQARLGSSPCLTLPRSTGMSSDAVWLFRGWIDGESLGSRLADGALPLGDALVIAAQVADALDRLHGAAIVHGAVRPGHVLLRHDSGELPHAVLIECGMAGARTNDSPFDDLGNVLYMAPEVSSGRPATLQSDLYALGCVLYEMLVGAPPFDGDDAATVVAWHAHYAPTIPESFPAVVMDLLRSLLAKSPSDRPTTARHVCRALEPLLPDRWMPRQVMESERPPPPPRSSAPPAPRASAQGASAPRVEAASGASASLASLAVAQTVPAMPQVVIPFPLVTPAAPSRAPSAAPEAPAFGAVGAPMRPLRLDDPGPIRLRSDDLTRSESVLLKGRPRRWLWFFTGLLTGIGLAVGGVWGLAAHGQFRLVIDALTNHLKVPVAMLALPPSHEREPRESRGSREHSAITTAMPAAAHDATAVAPPSTTAAPTAQPAAAPAPAEGAPVTDSNGDAEAQPAADAQPTAAVAAPPPARRMTAAERRRARRVARRARHRVAAARASRRGSEANGTDGDDRAATGGGSVETGSGGVERREDPLLGL